MATRLAGLILAAGSSKRMGDRNKLLLPYKQHSIIKTVVLNVLASPVDAVFVILGHQQGQVLDELKGLDVEPIINTNYAEGMGTSLSLGVQKLESLGYAACMVCLGDLPLLDERHYHHMANQYLQSGEEKIYLPFYLGEQGHPLIFTRPWFKSLVQLSGDRGAKGLLKKYKGSIVKVNFVDRAGLIDIDNDQEYLQLQERKHLIEDQVTEKSGENQASKLKEQEDYYFNDQGLMVFTAKYHLKRGYCCESGCLHCPYGFKSSSKEKHS